MKIFITGSTGFIGQNLVYFYKHHTVFEYRRGMDINVELTNFKPNLIVNCAAEIYNSELMYKTNVELVRNCLEYIKKNPLTRMVQLGSSSEYGICTWPTSENDVLRPNNMYAGTKGVATILCQTYANTYNLDIIIVRPYSPYGPGERPHRLFPALWRAFKLNQQMTLVQGVHDFCYIDDFIDAVDLVIRSDKRTPGEIINISSGEQHSNKQILDVFRKVTGIEGNVVEVDEFVTPIVWQADISHIKNKYSWKPKETLTSGIKKFLERANYE